MRIWRNYNAYTGLQGCKFMYCTFKIKYTSTQNA